MELLVLRSLWTNGFDLDAALADCVGPLYSGIEGPLPAAPIDRKTFTAKLTDSGVPFIAEVATGGDYVPQHDSLDRHLSEFRSLLNEARAAGPMFVTALAGCDRWGLTASVEFFGRAMAAAEECEVAVAFETHRSRATFTPWATRDLLEQLPGLRLTCDFSHWCCVAERLVLDGEPEILRLCAAHARHIHARVGYAQGPQVPHPAAPEYAGPLDAHERWWDALWDAAEDRGERALTITPEFGADGYQQCAPYTGLPAASLPEVNAWMAQRLRDRFAGRRAGL